MARKTPIGDANRLVVFSISGDNVVAPVFTFDKTTGASTEGSVETNNMSITFTSAIDNAAFLAFKKAYLRDIDVVDVEDVYTNGEKDSSKGSLAGVPKLLAVHCGAQDNEGQHAITALHSVLQIGTKNYNPNESVKNEITFLGTPVPVAFNASAGTIAPSYADICNISTNLTFPINTVGVEKYYNAV
jgi:hypothetical protein